MEKVYRLPTLCPQHLIDASHLPSLQPRSTQAGSRHIHRRITIAGLNPSSFRFVLSLSGI